MLNPRIRVFKRFVEDLATLSKCTDKHVAAIIIDKEATQVFSIGVNGGPKGGLDCLCTLGGKYTCAHAEANALAKCKMDCHGATMICTMSPCVTCATLIVNELNAIPHIKHLSQAIIAEHAGLKESKVRAALIDLLTEKKITQYQATENPRLQRFYYVINGIGSKQ
jgi:deoxycytidylate deaminase